MATPSTSTYPHKGDKLPIGAQSKAITAPCGAAVALREQEVAGHLWLVAAPGTDPEVVYNGAG